MNSRNAIERAIARLKLRGEPADAAREQMAVSLQDALRETAERAALLEDNVAELLRKNFVVVLVDGSADLTPHTNAAEPMLPHYIVKVVLAGVELRQLADEADLDRPWPADWSYYAVFENTLATRDTNGARTGLEGNAEVRASYVPLVENVPVQLQSLLVEVLASYAVPEMQATR